MNNAGETSPVIACETILGLKAMAHTGFLFHLAHQTSCIRGCDGVIGGIAVFHLTRYLAFIILTEYTSKGSTASIIIVGINRYFLDSQIVDAACHFSEDADGRAVDLIHLGIVVTFKGIVLTYGSPVTTSVVLSQNILDNDVALLLEVEVSRAGATVHVVGQLYQFAFFDDERIAFCSTALRENILIVSPLHIEFSGFDTYRHCFADFYP